MVKRSKHRAPAVAKVKTPAVATRTKAEIKAAEKHAEEHYSDAGDIHDAREEGVATMDSQNFARKQAGVAKPQGGHTVTVGLKIPNGIFLRLQVKNTVQRPTRDGGMVEITEWTPNYESDTYELYGNRVPFGETPRCLIVDGYAMTPGIPFDFWCAWREQNKDHDLVKNNLIIANERADMVADEAKDRGPTKRSGLEAIVPDKDLRIPKRKVVVDNETRTVGIRRGSRTDTTGSEAA